MYLLLKTEGKKIISSDNFIAAAISDIHFTAIRMKN